MNSRWIKHNKWQYEMFASMNFTSLSRYLNGASHLFSALTIETCLREYDEYFQNEL